MTAHKPSPLVPRLRFPEFRDDSTWLVSELGDIATITSGGTPSKNVSEYWNGHIPWISAASMYDTNLHDSERKVTALSIGNGTRIAKAGSLLILTRGSMLYNRVPIGIASIDVAFNQDVRALKIDATLNGFFLLYQLIAIEFLIPINDTGIGAGKIDTEDLRRLPVVFPTLVEQKKIADCLGSLDDLIAAEGQKLEALRQHKKGLMQQLFPQPGETVPRLRFPEFQDCPKWNMVPLSVASEVNPSNDNLPEQFIYIDLESVKSGVLVECNEIARDIAPSRAQRLLSRKDIIFQTVRPYQRNNFIFDIDDGYEYVASSGYAQIRTYGCPEFLYQLLHTDTFVSSVLTRCTGSNYPAINPTNLASIDLLLPGKSEQQKIADCLGSLDDLIAAEGRNLEALQQHKQGLMQQLFPNLEGK